MDTFYESDGKYYLLFKVPKRQKLESLIKHLEEQGLEPLSQEVIDKWTKEAELEEAEVLKGE